MSTILEFLRKGFEVLEELPADQIDDLINRIRLFRMNPNRGDNSTEVNLLLSDIGFFYYQVGKKIAQVQAIKDKIELEIDYILAHTKVKSSRDEEVDIVFNQNNKIAYKAEATRKNQNYRYLNQQLIECESLETYMKNVHSILFMEHYALRNQTQPTNNMHYTINH